MSVTEITLDDGRPAITCFDRGAEDQPDEACLRGQNAMRKIILLLSTVSLAACATTPPVATNYYPATSAMHVRVVRTVGCDKVGMPVVASTVTPATTHSADYAKPLSLSLKAIDSPMANADIKLEYYSDGRLKTINATTTGQGETILKSAISLITTAAEANLDRPMLKKKCKELKAAFGDTPLSLTFDSFHNFESLARIRMKADSQSQAHYDLYKELVGETCLVFERAEAPSSPVQITGGRGNGAILKAWQPGKVKVNVTVGPSGLCEASTIWSGLVAVGQFGREYEIPIPKAALFGEQIFGASFDESGAITLLQYGKKTGEGGALGALQAGLDAARITDAEKAASLKGEADVIAAQQRLVKCRTTPDSCS